MKRGEIGYAPNFDGAGRIKVKSLGGSHFVWMAGPLKGREANLSGSSVTKGEYVPVRDTPAIVIEEAPADAGEVSFTLSGLTMKALGWGPDNGPTVVKAAVPRHKGRGIQHWVTCRGTEAEELAALLRMAGPYSAPIMQAIARDIAKIRESRKRI